MGALLVSIVIPTYDRPKLLSKTLESIEGQTFEDYEVIVVDDGSPNEDTRAVCDGYSKVRYFKIENSGGPSKPRNVGIENSSGQYIAFVDDDDLWFPKKLEKQLEVLEKYPEFGLVHGCCEVIDFSGKRTNDIVGRPGIPSEKHGKVSLSMVGNWTLMTPTVMLRKDILDQVGYFNENMPQVGEDTEFWVRCSFYTSFYYIDEPLVFYRSHESNSVKLKTSSIYVPKHLKNAIMELKAVGLVSKSDYKIISNSLIRMQIKKLEFGFFKTLGLLAVLNPFWFLNFENVKLLLQKIITLQRM